jgi:uncharacterized coiled-coil DUF342 family protein
MKTKDEYVAQMKAKLDEWNAELDELEAKVRKKQAQTTQDYHERIAELKAKRNEASQQLTEIQSATGAAWESLAAGTERLCGDLKATLEETKNAFIGESQHE